MEGVSASCVHAVQDVERNDLYPVTDADALLRCARAGGGKLFSFVTSTGKDTLLDSPPAWTRMVTVAIPAASGNEADQGCTALSEDMVFKPFQLEHIFLGTLAGESVFRVESARICHAGVVLCVACAPGGHGAFVSPRP